MESMSRRADEVYCPHCGVEIVKKTYKVHKRLYFDMNSDQWMKRKAGDVSGTSSFLGCSVTMCLASM